MEDFDAPEPAGSTQQKETLAEKIDMTEIGIVIADDNPQDHSSRIAYLKAGGAAVEVYRIAGLRNHAAEINRCAQTLAETPEGRAVFVLLDINTNVPGFNGWDIMEFLENEFLPHTNPNKWYEILFISGDDVAQRGVVKKWGKSAGDRLIRKKGTPNETLADRLSAKAGTLRMMRRVGTSREELFMDTLVENRIATPSPDTLYTANAFVTELVNHIHGNAHIILEDDARLQMLARTPYPDARITRTDMVSGNTIPLNREKIVYGTEQSFTGVLLDRDALYRGRKSGAGTINVFSAVTDIARALYLLTQGEADYHVLVADGALPGLAYKRDERGRKTAEHLCDQTAIRVIIGTELDQQTRNHLAACFNVGEYQRRAEEKLGAVFTADFGGATDKVRFELLIPNAKLRQEYQYHGTGAETPGTETP